MSIASLNAHDQAQILGHSTVFTVKRLMSANATISRMSDVVIYMAHLPLPRQRAQAPICRHWQATSPCCTEAPPLSRWRTQHLDLGDISDCPILLQDAIQTFNNCINGTALLAEATVNALRHVNIVSRSPSATIFSLFRFDCDG
jgi:hypothetical protein